MMLLIAHRCHHGATITKIKYDFDNAFWYDMFIMEGSESFHLPNGMYYLCEMFRCWYVVVVVQCPRC